MSNIITIDTTDGIVKIDSDLMKGYLSESYEYLDTISEAQKNFKDVVETVSDTTGLKKALVSKYLKERYELKTKKTKELGELFGKLDEAVVG